MQVSAKEEFTISISGDIARAIQKHYERDAYSLMVENFFRLTLPKKEKKKSATIAMQLRGCAASSGLVDKTDWEIKNMMYREKYGI